MIKFKKTLGHPNVKEYLKRLLNSETLPSSILFAGPEGVGKATCALEFVKIYFCEGDEKPCEKCTYCLRINHLNFSGFRPVLPADIEKKIIDEINCGSISSENLRGESFSRNLSIKIEQIRNLKEEIIYPPHERDRIFYLFLDADLMGREAQNAFLKTLEEPPPYITFILISSHPELVLPTIRSRTQKVIFSTLSFEDFSKYSFPKGYNIEYLYNLSGGSIGKAKSMISWNIEELKKKILQILVRGKSPYNILRGEITRDQLVMMCGIIQFMLKDLLYIKSGVQEGIVFQEMLPFYARYKDKLSRKEIEKRFYQILELEDAIKRRVNLSLIVLSLPKFAFV